MMIGSAQALFRGTLIMLILTVFPGCGGGGDTKNSSANSAGTSIELSATSVTFNYILSGTAPSKQTVTAEFEGAALAVGYPPGVAEPSWLTVSQSDSNDDTSPVDFDLSVNTGDLTAGTYTTTVRFVTGDAGGDNVSYKDLTVTCVVTNELTVNKTSLEFSHTNGASTAPDGQTVLIGGAGIAWTASADQDWVMLDTRSGTAPSSLEIGVSPGGLSTSGSYNATVTVKDKASGRSKLVSVNLVVEPHKLFVGDNGVAFSTFPTAPSVLSHTVTVAENAGVSVPWQASSNQPWLTVTPSGMTKGELTLSADPDGLTGDTIHYAQVSISSSEATIENQETVTVGLYVSSSDPAATELAINGRYLLTDPVRPYAYVTDSGTSVDIYNIYTGTLVSSINAGVQLKAMTIASDGDTLYVIDGDDDAIVPISLGTFSAGSKWQAEDFSQSSPMLEYMRFNGQGVVISNRREVFDVRDGTQVATVPHAYFDNIVLSASEDGASFFVTRPWVSGQLDLLRYTGDYSTVKDLFSVEQTHALNRSFTNVRDIAVNRDGTKIYISSGGEYDFLTFQFDGSDITEGTSLDANPYPLAVEVGPTGKLYGGINALQGATDAWSFTADGILEDSYGISGHLHDKQIRLSADGLRMLTLSDTPALTFSRVTP